MCLYPKIAANKKYLPNKKNNYNPPPLIDETFRNISIPCGNCKECRDKVGRAWQVRLNEDIKVNSNGHFVTLTFSDESFNKLHDKIVKSQEYHSSEINALPTMAVRQFLEEWRYREGKSVRHWLITELGHINTERIHIHGIIWTEKPELISKYWNFGISHLGYSMNEKCINYVVKYVTKVDKDHIGYKPKILTSKGIGKNYLNSFNSRLNKFNTNNTNEIYITPSGIRLNLPTYYRNHLYTSDEKEQLWRQKSQLPYTWIMKEKVNNNIPETSKQNILDYYKRYNKTLGYGDGTETFEAKLYRKGRKLENKRKHKK